MKLLLDCVWIFIFCGKSVLYRQGFLRAFIAMPYLVRYVWRLYVEERKVNFDATYGTDTLRPIDVSPLWAKAEQRSTESPTVAWYQPDSISLTNAALSFVTIEPKHSVFVDLGSGKGRVLLLASEYPYQKLIGVEFSRQCHDAALRNVDAYQQAKGKTINIELLNEDARAFVFPEKHLVLYLFNSFGPTVLAEVMKNLKASFDQKPRQLTILATFFDDELRKILDDCPILRRRNIANHNCRSLLVYDGIFDECLSCEGEKADPSAIPSQKS